MRLIYEITTEPLLFETILKVKKGLIKRKDYSEVYGEIDHITPMRLVIELLDDGKKPLVDDAVANYATYSTEPAVEEELAEDQNLRGQVWYARVAGKDPTNPLPLIVKVPFKDKVVTINVGVTTRIRDLVQNNQINIDDWVVGVYGENIGKPVAVDKILKTW